MYHFTVGGIPACESADSVEASWYEHELGRQSKMLEEVQHAEGS
jgi:hypothetical protein